MNRPMVLGLWCALMLVGAEAGLAAPFYTSGHADLGIGFEGGAFDIHIHAEGATIGGAFVGDHEYEADEIIIFVPMSSAEVRSANFLPVLNFDPIGVGAGATFYKLEQTAGGANGDNAPFLGVATEEIDSGVFVGDEVTLSIVNVVGPGFFSMYQDVFPGPSFKVSSLNGLPDSFTFDVGIHDHFNYAFTAPGFYEVTLRASGTLVGGGVVSGEGTYRFAVVVPEVGTSVLMGGVLGSVMVGGVLRRRRSR